MITIAKHNKNPKVLVVTPLLPGHKISRDTKITIKRNNTPILWLLSEGNNNIPTNIQNGLNWYKENVKDKIPYILPLDRDIVLGRSMIDRMVFVLDIVPDNVAFTYANFEFKGVVDRSFPAIPYDINLLLQNNYISSNSLIKIDKLNIIGGFVTEEKYRRLLDWVLWLRFFDYGYVGLPTPNANFVAISSSEDISAGTNEDFIKKRSLILHEVIKPIMTKHYQPPPEEEAHNILTFEDVL